MYCKYNAKINTNNSDSKKITAANPSTGLEKQPSTRRTRFSLYGDGLVLIFLFFGDCLLVLLYDGQHLCGSNNERLLGEVLDVSRYQIRIFLGQCHLIEDNVVKIRKYFIRMNPF